MMTLCSIKYFPWMQRTIQKTKAILFWYTPWNLHLPPRLCRPKGMENLPAHIWYPQLFAVRDVPFRVAINHLPDQGAEGTFSWPNIEIPRSTSMTLNFCGVVTMTAAVILKYQAENVGGGLKVDRLVMAFQLIDFPKPSIELWLKRTKKHQLGTLNFEGGACLILSLKCFALFLLADPLWPFKSRTASANTLAKVTLPLSKTLANLWQSEVDITSSRWHVQNQVVQFTPILSSPKG